MEHVGGAPDALRDALGIADVARHHLDAIQHVTRRLGQPTQTVPGVVIDERTDLPALAHERFDEVAANEAVGSGDKRGLPGQGFRHGVVLPGSPDGSGPKSRKAEARSEWLPISLQYSWSGKTATFRRSAMPRAMISVMLISVSGGTVS